MATEIKGRTALVTGGAIRVGKAIALALADRGANVAITYRSSVDEAEAIIRGLRDRGKSAVAVHCDQRDPEQIRQAIAEIEEALGPIDILVNNASVFRSTPVGNATLEDWDEHLEVNLRGPWLFSQKLGPEMKLRGYGVILNMLDIAAQSPMGGYLPYSVSKAGLEALTLGLAKLLGPEVRVNGIAPGVVMWPEGFSRETQKTLLRRTPMQRAGAPKDVAEAAVYLIERATFVTGAVLPLDGGLSL
jgi:pteridine reductase